MLNNSFIGVALFVACIIVIVRLYRNSKNFKLKLEIEKKSHSIYASFPDIYISFDSNDTIIDLQLVTALQQNFPLFITEKLEIGQTLKALFSEFDFQTLRANQNKLHAVGSLVEFDFKNEQIYSCIFHVHLFKKGENEFLLAIRKPTRCTNSKIINGNNLIIFNHLVDAVICIDSQNEIVFWNKQAEKFFGWKYDEVVGKKTIDCFLKKEYIYFLNQEKEKYFSSKDKYNLNEIKECVGHNKEMGEFPVELSTLPFVTDDNTEVFCIIIRNISEQKTIKETLINNQEFLNAIINTTPACVKIIDSSGRILSINNTGLDILEADQLSDLHGKSFYPLVEPDYLESYKKLNEKVCAGTPQTLIYEVIGLKGTRKWMETRAVPLKHANGQIVQLALTDEITDRIKVEDELLRSESLKHTILSSIADAFFALDINWNFIYVNKHAEILFDRTYKELIGKNFWDEYPEINISHFYKKYLQAMYDENQIEFEYYYPQTKKWLRVKIYPSREGFSIFNQDITKDKIEQTVLDLERSMLLENNKGTKTLSQIFYNSARVVESIIPQTFCSIHRISENGKTLINFSSPSLPNKVIEKMTEIDLEAEALYTDALNTEDQVIIQDIPNQSKYADLKDIFRGTDIVSCVSLPLIATKGEKLGVFTIYFKKNITKNLPELKILKKIQRIYREILEERRKADELTKLSLIAKNTDKAVFITNLNHEITWVNDAFTHMTGYEYDDAIGRHPIDLLQGPSSDKTNIAHMKEQMDENKSFTLNTIFHKRNGTLYWSRITGQPLYNEVGQISQFFAIQEDTTIRKLAKLDLQDSEKRYRALFHSNPQPMFIYDKSTLKFNEVNESAQKTYGFTPDEFNEMSMVDLFVESDKELFTQSNDKINYRNNMLLNPEIKYENYSHYTKENKVIHVEMVRNEILISGKETILVIINDVTNKLVIEKELRRSNQRFSYASKAVSDVIWEWDIRKKSMYWGDGLAESFGYENEEEKPTAANFNEFVHPEDYAILKKDYCALLKNSNENYWSAEYRFLKKSGQYADVLDRAYVIRDHEGAAIKVIGAMKNITIQKNHEIEKAKLIGQTQEFERKRFSMELHDGLAQHLIVLNLYLSQFTENEPVDGEMLSNCFNLVKTSLNQTRSMCYNLTPPELENGLIKALKAMFDRLKTLNSIDFAFEISSDICDDDFVKTDIYNLYRIIQEFVNNSIKHSKGTLIKLVITKLNGQIKIEVFDNGVGYDNKSITNGLGLNNIEKRAKLANVKFEMLSEIGVGTNLSIIA